jgi:hypothetical protein
MTSIKKYPPYLWREDGSRFTKNEDDTYSHDDTKINMPTCYYRYTFEHLMNTGKFYLYEPRVRYEQLKKDFDLLNSHLPYSLILMDVSHNYFRDYEQLKKEFE